MIDDLDRASGKQDRLARFYRVLQVLESRGDEGATPAEIARLTGVSKRTVYRDLIVLQNEIKAPIWSEGGRWGVADTGFLKPLAFTRSEAMAMVLAARLVVRYADEHDPDLAGAFQKLASALPAVLSEHVSRSLDTLARRPADPDYSRHLHLLTQAWADRRVVRFTYDTSIHAPGAEAREAVVRPWYLEPSLATHALYLIGWDETRDAVRTFKVDRIRDLSLTTADVRAARGDDRPGDAQRVGHHLGPARDRRGAPIRAVGRRARPRDDAGTRASRSRSTPMAPCAGGRGSRARSRSARGSSRGGTRSRCSSRRTCARRWPRSTGSRRLATTAAPAGSRGRPRRRDPVTHPEIPSGFRLVNLISDPIHGYVELTKRATAAEARDAGLPAEDAAEEDLLDTAWMQRLRRVSQLQSARWVFPTAEHSRFTHGLGVMHEAGLWARALYPTLRSSLRASGEAVPSEGLVVETLRVAGLLHDVGHGPFAHFFDEHVLAAFPAPADERRPDGKRLTHEDLSALIIERELGGLIGALRRAPGSAAERDGFADGESIDPRWVSFLISKPAIVDPAMPAWVRRLQPLLSGVFTVDNLDYVRRDAYLTGVAVGPVDVERLRRYAFVGPDGLSLYEPGVGALEMFLTARFFMYRQVYFHRTVRAIDLDLGEVFADSVRAIAGDASPADVLETYADLDEYALLHQAARWARGRFARRRRRSPATGRCARRSATAGGRSCCAGRAGGARPRCGSTAMVPRCRRTCWHGWGRRSPGASRSTRRSSIRCRRRLGT